MVVFLHGAFSGMVSVSCCELSPGCYKFSTNFLCLLHSRGRGDDGRLGHGDTGWKYVPKITQALQGQMIVQVTCGSYHTAAVSENGELYTWGGGMYGKLGHGNERGESSPKRVEALANVPVSQIACGSRHTAVVTSRGELICWDESKLSSAVSYRATRAHVFFWHYVFVYR